MKTYLVAVYDTATETYGRPFPVNHPAQAMRSFQDEVNNAQSEIAKHPSDYELWQVGTFDDVSGSLEASLLRLARASDLVKV